MLRNNPEYRRLRVDGYGAMGSASYWLGRDHLLVVTTTSYVENYYRFLYADIQALIIRRHPLRLVWGSVFSILAISSLLGAWAVKAEAPAGSASQETLFIMAGLLAVALMFTGLQTLNLLRGPTCVCHLRTAVQVLRLPHLNRWRKAELLIARLTPLALAAQTQLVPQPAATEAAESAPPGATAAATSELQPEGGDGPNPPPRISP